jgi:hypothetical protein
MPSVAIVATMTTMTVRQQCCRRAGTADLS